MCDSLRITPKPNNGTLRLPLKPVGFHPQDSGVDDPLEPSFQSEITMQPASQPTAAPAPQGVSNTQPFEPEVSDSNEVIPDDNQGQADAEHEDNPSLGWWASLIDKLDAAKVWMSQTFASGKADNTSEQSP